MFSAGSAVAQDDPVAKADALFKRGRLLMKEGDYRAACSLLAESQRLDPAVGTLINLGDCSEQGGRVADALEAYRRVAQLLRPDDSRRGPVEAQIRTLERRVPTLRLRIARPAPAGLRVTWDGVALDPTEWGIARPVNAGPHELRFAVPGKEPTRRGVVLAEAENRDLTIDLDGDPVPALRGSDRVTPERSRPTAAVPWIVGGSGVASLAASGVFFMLHRSETRELERNCIDRVCPTSSESTIDRANQYGTAGWVTLVAGAVGVGAAVVLFETGSGETPAASERRRLEIGASPARGGGAAFARARF